MNFPLLGIVERISPVIAGTGKVVLGIVFIAIEHLTARQKEFAELFQ